jgi:hypothetical protein
MVTGENQQLLAMANCIKDKNWILFYVAKIGKLLHSAIMEVILKRTNMTSVWLRLMPNTTLYSLIWLYGLPRLYYFILGLILELSMV